MSNTLSFEKQDGIATLTLNRPKAFNSFTREMALALQAALDDCATDDAVRVVVLTGEGRAFCAGQDLVEVTDPEKNPGYQVILDEHFAPIITKMRHLPKPIITAVNGVAAGAGANIALAGDIVIATEKANFIQAFSSIGLIPDSGGTYILPRLVGYQKAMAIAMLGDKISAAEAEKMGMIYKAVPTEEFTETIQRLAKRVAKMPTKGLALTKEAFNRGIHNTLKGQLAVETELQLKAFATDDYTEGVTAFLEKRKPTFTGK